MDIIETIKSIVGENGVLTGADVSDRPGDWLSETRCGAKAIIRPRSTEELSRVMKLCHAAKQPVVPAGGLTGLVHGADATSAHIQISFERMRAIISIDPIGRTMTVEAGVPLQLVHQTAEEHGLVYGVDLGARGSCTIGGNIATNAGGNTVIRYGMTRENVLGIEAVLADGTIISSMNSLLKNNAAYDLKQMFIGSEGTLGLVTQAVLRLRPKPSSDITAILAIDDFDQLTALFQLMGNKLGGLLSSFEVMWNEHYQLIAVESGRHQPPLLAGYNYYVIIEAQGSSHERDAETVEEALSEALEAGLAQDAVIASSRAQRDAIWAIREDIEGLAKALLPGVTFDVSLPISEMYNYTETVKRAIKNEWGDEVRYVIFGHIGDGNLHLMVAPRPWSPESRLRAEEIVYGPLAAIKGSVSAEHGIGLEKRRWLPMSRSEEEIALMRTLKAALDPHNLLNPGKIL